MARKADINIPLCQRLVNAIETNVNQVIRGQERAVRKLLAGFISGGHVLLEDYPGTGKTTLAKALAKSVSVEFKRIQFTPDLLPSDILGVSILAPDDNKFHFHPGPLFGDIILADEINRASPRTQSALLEAMAEGQVSVDGRLHALNDTFFVVATQNPVESHGTYPLPEAQMDRFALKFSLGYVEPAVEATILADQETVHPLRSMTACLSVDELKELKENVQKIRMSDELRRYCVDIVAATRKADGVRLGASPRGSLALMTVSKALALFDGMEFVLPEHIKEIAVDVLAHRLILDREASFSGIDPGEIIAEIIRQIKVPA